MQRMVSRILIYIRLDPEAAAQYAVLLKARFPKVTVVVAGSAEEARHEIKTAHALLAFGSQLPHGFLEGARELRWIQSLGTGVDGIVDQPFLRDDVIVTSTRGIHSTPMCELAILLMLSLLREFPRTIRAQQTASWDRWRMKTLAGRTVGIVGTGLIASALAPRCQAMDMKVVGLSRTPRSVPGFDAMFALSELTARVREFDFLVLLIPYSDATRHIVNETVLAAMKPTSYLLNLARGGVLDEEALLRTLRNRGIAGAALDVMQQEPLPPEHPFWQLKNIILTPHVGGYYDKYVEDAGNQICVNLAALLSGRLEDLKNRAR